MPITPFQPVAFRCKACGRFHTADDAAEALHPHACRVCGSGVSFNPKGVRTVHPENWEVLEDATPERLKELGLESHHIAGHTPWTKEESRSRDPVHLTRTVSEGTVTADNVG